MQERIEGLRESVAGISQRLQAPKNWIGSPEINLFKIVCDVLDLLQQMNSQMASHTHLPGPQPSSNDVAVFTIHENRAKSLSSDLKKITL